MLEVREGSRPWELSLNDGQPREAVRLLRLSNHESQRETVLFLLVE